MGFRAFKFTAFLAMILTATSFAIREMDYATYARIGAFPGAISLGAGMELPKHSKGARLSGGAVFGESKNVHVGGIYNEGDYKSKSVDANYRISHVPLFGSIDKFTKYDWLTINIGCGISDGIFSTSGIGFNMRFFEAGLTSFQRFTYQTNKISAFQVLDSAIIDISEDKRKLVFQWGAGAYAGIFLGPIAIGYSGNIYRPVSSIAIDDFNLDYSFTLPYILTNNFTISYWISDKTEFSVGTTNLMVDFNGGNWSLFAEISLWSF